MATAFIIRPFGKQKTRINEVPVEIDFNRVERELIDPALDELEIEGRTTGEIVEAGNIRDDMFQMLLTRDLVVADVSIHNANVFYELGVRHALRDRWTVLIRCKGDPMPFDNLTDRYFEYDRENPGAGVEGLAEAIKRTLVSQVTDSPIFRSVPNLKAQDPGLFIAVPSGFGDEVEIAKDAKQVGDLQLLAAETAGFPWQKAGLRAVGRALFELNSMPAAREAWESILEQLPDDHETNEKLGTIYQRLAERSKSDEEKSALLTRSNQCLERVLKVKDLEIRRRAEIHSLMGRNYKSRWQEEWKDLVDKKREVALDSMSLRNSLEAYNEGFQVDLNHFYPGLNAAGMLTVLTSLADSLPEAWSGMWPTDQRAQLELQELKDRLATLLPAVGLSLQSEKKRMQAEKRKDVWFDLSAADLQVLTLDRPSAVARAYRDALAGAMDFHRDSAARQLQIYQSLGLMTVNVDAALAVINPPAGGRAVDRLPPRTILFTGHRVDSPGRTSPRFPASKESEARAAIGRAIDQQVALAARNGREVVGISGGASGGDILFHEACREKGVPTVLYLAMPRDEFVAASVADSGPEWMTRFDDLYAALPFRQLGASVELPVWLRRKEGYSIWARNNLWMLRNAMVNGGKVAALIALWDGATGDGPGGTDHMVQEATNEGAQVIIISTKTL